MSQEKGQSDKEFKRYKEEYMESVIGHKDSDSASDQFASLGATHILHAISYIEKETPSNYPNLREKFEIITDATDSFIQEHKDRCINIHLFLGMEFLMKSIYLHNDYTINPTKENVSTPLKLSIDDALDGRQTLTWGRLADNLSKVIDDSEDADMERWNNIKDNLPNVRNHEIHRGKERCLTWQDSDFERASPHSQDQEWLTYNKSVKPMVFDGIKILLTAAPFMASQAIIEELEKVERSMSEDSQGKLLN